MIKLLLLLFIALVIVAVKFLPWWGILIAAVIAMIGFKYFVRYLFLMPFRMKGAVLHGAKLDVHSVTPATKPETAKSADGEHEAEAADPEHPRDYCWIEATITPNSGAGSKFTHWEPGELLISSPGKNPMNDSDGEDIGEIQKLEIFEDGAFKADEGMKYAGPQRLKMLFAIQPGIREVQLNYYFESLGTIKLK